MTPRELLDLIAALRDSGVSHFKNGDIEIDFREGHIKPAVNVLKLPVHQASDLKPVSLKEPPKESDQKIPDIVHEMQTIYKMSDSELIDRLFPITSEDEAGA